VTSNGPRLGLVLGTALVLGLAGAGCAPGPVTTPAPTVPSTAAAPTSPSTNAALCAAATAFQAAANELVGLNAAAVGTDGVKAALQKLGTAASGLADAAQATYAPQVAALRQSITALGNTVAGLQNQTDLSAKLGAIATSISAVERAAAPIVDSARTGCPSVPTASLPTAGPSTQPTT
jgi:hypothetical protein